MNVQIDTVGDIGRHLEPLQAGLSAAIDPALAEQRLAAALEPFGPTGPWKYAPLEEREKARRGVEAELARESGESLYCLEHTARAAERWLDPVEAELMEPSDPVTAWQQERRQSSLATVPPSDVIALGILSELLDARHAREMQDARPDQVLEAYRSALQQPYTQANAALIRHVEVRHGRGWTGRSLDGNAAQANAAQALAQAIREAREARVPADVKTARAAIANAYRLAQHAKERRVRSQVVMA